MNQILEIDSVILEFGTRMVLNDVYMKCETGKVTGMLGRNGTGKSSILKILFGVLEPNDKSIRLNGVPIYNKYRSPEDMRYLPQVSFIPKHLSIKRIFNYFKLDFKDFIKEFPDFQKFQHSKFKTLSGGEQRLIEIYNILASHSKFCLLDEPFTEIMPLHVETLKKLILKEKENKGIIVTDHMYKDIIDVSDTIYVVHNGKTNLIKDLHDLELLGYAGKSSIHNA